MQDLATIAQHELQSFLAREEFGRYGTKREGEEVHNLQTALPALEKRRGGGGGRRSHLTRVVAFLPHYVGDAHTTGEYPATPPYVLVLCRSAERYILTCKG
jgi:hypothetical protein